MNLGKSPARFDGATRYWVSFDDIAGIDEDFEEIVSFLKEPEIYACWSKDTKRYY
jgi:ATP-dependent Zn protease